MAIKGPHPPSDEHPHHEQHSTLNAHQQSDQRVSQKCQQQFQGKTTRTSLLTGRGLASLDAHVLPPVGALDADPFETTAQDERGHGFLQVHTHAQSVDGPVCVPGEPRKMVDDHGPTPTRYKKDTPLNAVDSQHHVTQFV